MLSTKKTKKITKSKVLFALIGLLVILFVSSKFLRFNSDNYSPLYLMKSAHTRVFASSITNVTDANATVLFPEICTPYYINSSNGIVFGTLENLKNETRVLSFRELYESADQGRIYADISFNTTGMDINELTILKLNWECTIVSTASSALDTRLNIYIKNSVGWELLHNATNTGGLYIDRKIGWWEHEITSNIGNYVNADTIVLRFEAEQTLPSSQNNWYFYLSLYWTNAILGKNIDFVRINASSINLVYNDTAYEQTGTLDGLNAEDGNILSLQLNQIDQGGRNNITYDIGYNLSPFHLDDIFGFSFYHDDWFFYSAGSPPPELGTINVLNTTADDFYPIQYLRDTPIVYGDKYPKQGFSGYILSGNKWWNTSNFKLRYFRDITGLSDWAKIEMDLGYIEIIKRIGPIFSVSLENTSKYIYQTEYVNIYVEDYNSSATDIRVLSTEGVSIIGSTEGNYTFEIIRDIKGWYNFSVQVTDDQENIITKGRYRIWFNSRPVNFDITLTPIPEEVQVYLLITDSITGDPIPNKEFDLLIFRFGETSPYNSYPGLSTNGSGLYTASFSVSPYLDEVYTFNFTTPEDDKYDRCSATSSVTCDKAYPKFTITNVDYNSEFSGEQVTIYYDLEDWTVPIQGVLLKENGNVLINLPTTPGSYQVSFITKAGNNNYTFSAINIRYQYGESEIINLNLKLKPVQLDVFSLYLDNFYYFFINVVDNQTGRSLDNVPVQVSIYDSGFLMFTGTITTHSVIFGGFPFDQTADHNFLIKAEINSNNYINLKKEFQIPFEAYPYQTVLTFGFLIPTIILGLVFMPQIFAKKWRFKKIKIRRLN
ncbi:MAG: hypothetical protein ACTSRG_17830 [Candidatus Helarchaeota archaeon]